jgi:hypothetical protein
VAEEVDELAFLFRVHSGPDLHSFGGVPSIHMALASLVTLKAPTVGCMARPSGTEGTQRLSSHNSAAMIAMTASSMLSCS